MSSRNEARGRSARVRVLPLILLLITVVVFANSLRVPEANAVPIELFYDNGFMYAAAGPFAGVKFSLPAGVSSARILTVRYKYAATGPYATLNIHITGPDHVTELTTPISTLSTVFPGFNDYDVSSLNIVVSGDFYVVLEKTGSGDIVQDNVANVGRSFMGGSLAGLTTPTLYNLVIRAIIDPITPGPPARPVGGVLTPVNKLAILAPYLALIGLVGAVTVAVAVQRRRKP